MAKVSTSFVWFRLFAKLTAAITIIVVLAGSLVKVTGSGMGCPDWPKCFGHYIPPVNAKEVSWGSGEDYFKGQMILHNGQLLIAEESFQSSSAFSIDNWKIYEKHGYSVYNPTHTIIEYVNRLATVVLGLASLLMLIMGLVNIKRQKSLFIWSLVVLVLILFEAWLGRLVVDSVLSPIKISIHLYAAFVIVLIISALLVFTNPKHSNRINLRSKYSTLGLIMLVMLFIQVFLGTKVRELFDVFSDSLIRSEWVDNAGLKFLIHRSFSLVYFGMIIYLYLQIRKESTNFVPDIQKILLLVLISIASGVIMGYFDVPQIMQPIHIFISGVLIFYQGQLTFKLLKQ